jgi:hypothetical protein
VAARYQCRHKVCPWRYLRNHPLVALRVVVLALAVMVMLRNQGLLDGGDLHFWRSPV